MINIAEQWKTIDDSNYEVSTLGRVRNTKTGRTINGRLNKKDGYYRVNLGGREEYIHKLVIDTFGEGERRGTYVRHCDRNKTNNALSNLEWIDPKYKK